MMHVEGYMYVADVILCQIDLRRLQKIYVVVDRDPSFKIPYNKIDLITIILVKCMLNACILWISILFV